MLPHSIESAVKSCLLILKLLHSQRQLHYTVLFDNYFILLRLFILFWVDMYLSRC